MKEGHVVLTPLPQADGQIKSRPALLLRQLPPFGDFLVCGISTQIRENKASSPPRLIETLFSKAKRLSMPIESLFRSLNRLSMLIERRFRPSNSLSITIESRHHVVQTSSMSIEERV